MQDKISLEYSYSSEVAPEPPVCFLHEFPEIFFACKPLSLPGDYCLDMLYSDNLHKDSFCRGDAAVLKP